MWFQAVGVATICSNVHGHSAKDIFFFFFFAKTFEKPQDYEWKGKSYLKEHVHHNVSNSIVLSRFSGTPKVANMCIASQEAASSEDHHEQYTHIPRWTCSGPLNNAPRAKSRRPAFWILILSCRFSLSLRRRFRHVSNRASANETISFIQALLSAPRRLTM